MASGSRWQLTAPAEMRWVQWGDEWVLYHGASGDTHLLDGLAVEVLRSLEHAPATAEGLVAGLAQDGDEETRRQLSAYIDSLVSTLARLGVIEPA
ncbi:MAG: HPr-rel-A system PqqD family peptide chaperone [Nitrospirota bacterium]|jgi:PqqD family protein of HPr-rel-A system